MISQVRPCPLWRAVTLAVLLAVYAAIAWTDRSALAGPRPKDRASTAAAAPDLENQSLSIERVHRVGVAMASWLDGVTDAGEGAGAPGDETSASDDETGVAAAGGTGATSEETAAGETAAEEADPTTADWSACPPISYDELAALLVGTHVEELPRTDGWGHPFEYCLDRERTGASRYAVGVRSPGRDGRWQGETYPVGGFASDELDGDLLWIDGYFVTWPRPR